MFEIPEPGLLADLIELELARFREAGRMFRVAPSLEDLADALARVAAMLREADHRG